uniref:Secreted protein n=1 Tax=Anopheles darlingi TaxID=43151 RepID=A0A2M4D6C3_ANODA
MQSPHGCLPMGLLLPCALVACPAFLLVQANLALDPAAPRSPCTLVGGQLLGSVRWVGGHPIVACCSSRFDAAAAAASHRHRHRQLLASRSRTQTRVSRDGRILIVLLGGCQIIVGGVARTLGRIGRVVPVGTNTDRCQIGTELADGRTTPPLDRCTATVGSLRILR